MVGDTKDSADRFYKEAFSTVPQSNNISTVPPAQPPTAHALRAWLCPVLRGESRTAFRSESFRRLAFRALALIELAEVRAVNLGRREKDISSRETQRKRGERESSDMTGCIHEEAT